MKSISILKHNLMRAAMTLALILTCAAAWAQTTQSVTYIDAYGQQQTVDATLLTASTNSTDMSGWYVASGTFTNNNRLMVNYDYATLNLILADDCHLTMTKGLQVPSHATLNIYSQSKGSSMGKLTITAPNNYAGIGGSANPNQSIPSGNINIYGGDLNITGGSGGAGIGGGRQAAAQGAILITNGAKVVATGGFSGAGIGGGYQASFSSITITGNATVTASATNGGEAIGRGQGASQSGTLSITNSTVNNVHYDADGFQDGSTHTVTFNSQGGTAVAAQTVGLKYGQTIVKANEPTVPTRTYYVFGGWYKESNCTNAWDFDNDAVTEDITLYAKWTPDPDHFSVSNDGNTYTIHTATGWGLFCDALQDNDTYNRFSGDTVKLGTNIGTAQDPITRMAGSSYHDFMGTFDGQGHTLTVDYGSAESPITADNAAPFVNVESGCIIKNLHVAGDIYTSGKNAAGIAGTQYGAVTIRNCRVSTAIHSYTIGDDDDGTHGGLVGNNGNGNGSALSIVGCVFDGKLLTEGATATIKCGGFVGWRHKEVTISNSLFAPTEVTIGTTSSATFARNGATITNCYYTTDFNDGEHFTAQGKQARSITAGDYVTVENAGENAGTATTYSTSGITSYGTGIKYYNVLYAGSGETVSLTLDNTVPEGFTFTDYSVTEGAILSGSGNAYTLTMPDADVVITANTNVNYIDVNGAAQQCTDYIWLTGTETTLGAAGQETWCVVQGTLNYSHGIQLLGNTHIILCDGAAMNIGTSDNPVSGEPYQENVGFYGSGNNLSLYAQSGNTGALTIYSQSCSFDVKDLTIAGGNLNATTITTSPVIGCSNNLTVRRSSLEIHANGPAVQANDVTLSNVTANINSSNSSGFSCSNFTVDHSQLTVNAISYYPAIQASVITLGCTAATDFIKATCTSFLTSSYSGTVKIADGQTLYDGANAYTGTLTDAERQTIGGRKLTNVAPPTYDYIDLDGTGATHTAVVIDADNMPTALSGWYIVQGTVSYTNTIDLAGDTHIILADNAVMNVTVTGYNNGIQSTSGNNYSLFVYGQTGQSGELNVTSDRFACYIIYGGDITIAGGKVTASGTMGIHAQYYNNNGGNVTIKNATVTATGTSYNGILSENGGNITIDNSNVTATSTGSYVIFAQKGGITIDNSNVTATATNNGTVIYAGKGDITIANGTVTASGTQYGIFTENGSVTINGGQVTATGNIGIYTIGSVTINGGQVTATGNTYGIFAQNSSDHITLGWTNPTDFIYVNKYYTYGTLSIAEGKTFIDENNTFYSGTVAMVSGAYPIDGKRLYPYSENAVPYLNENGQQRYCVAYTTLTGTETELGTGGQETWYVVGSDVSYTGLTINGDIHLILADGKTMTITSSDDNGIIVSSSLTIYGQELGTGTLNATGNNGIYSDSGDITIIGGTLNATGNNGIYSVSGDITIIGGTLNAIGNENGIHSYSGNITISGGTVTATDNSTGYGIFTHSGNITISGGRVTATSENGHGIYSYDGTTTLGWTNATDFIYVSRYYIGTSGTLNIAEGKTFIDEAGYTYSSGTVNASAIAGKTLYPDCVVMKHITGYGNSTESDHWVFIASPVAGSIAPSEVHNLFPSAGETSNEYDLYRFNQSSSNGKEWQNWKQDEGHNNVAPGFSLVNGHGYLYATKETRTLVFAGEFRATTEPVEVPLDYDGNAQFAGWNLVGNPFAVGATLTQPYYRMNADGSALKTEIEETEVAAMEGVFVQATGNNQTVTFTAQTRGGEQAAIAQANIMVGGDNGAVIDNAIIRFDGGQTLEKFSFREGSTKLYIPQDGTDYAIACAESTGEMPVNFKAEENGTYTLTVSTTLNSQLSTLNYLHLIDNLTGADVDLLTPAGNSSSERGLGGVYTFTAKTTDYESRFKLVFAVGSSTGSDTFAFISNGNLIVNGEGTLQVFDVLGHQLITKQLSTLNSQLSTLNYKSGVYVLRLINGENVRTQKIVIE